MLLTVVNTLDNFVRFFSLLLIFVFVLAVTYFTTRYIANYQKGKLSNSNITVLEASQIAPGKYIQIVKIGNRYFALAVCKDTVTVLAELKEDEIQLLEDKGMDLPGFKDIMEKAKEKLSKEKK
ncbi:MAG: flagellar biosynthetic protein FliO [Lachnospiraceae bacterium]|nr:flagellar biosynthetic protein FliO [Lachnospiraceae bacterium]